MSRHLKTSILVCSQVFQGGLSKQLRANCNVFALLANKSIDCKKAIAAELSSYVSLDDRIQLWDLATEEPHAFLLIDVRNRARMFRKNWDLVLSPAKRSPPPTSSSAPPCPAAPSPSACSPPT
jgi:hypothetical protein